MIRTFVLFFILIFSLLNGHEGHSDVLLEITPIPWLEKIGRFHLIFLHFPIALIVMTAAAEVLWVLFANPLFTHAARFMILAAAIFALPTALLGYAFSFGFHYEGIESDLFFWHGTFGFITAGLAILTAILRERCVHDQSPTPIPYYLSLFALFLFVSLTGAFGGSLAFGLDVW